MRIVPTHASSGQSCRRSVADCFGRSLDLLARETMSTVFGVFRRCPVTSYGYLDTGELQDHTGCRVSALLGAFVRIHRDRFIPQTRPMHPSSATVASLEPLCGATISSLKLRLMASVFHKPGPGVEDAGWETYVFSFEAHTPRFRAN